MLLYEGNQNFLYCASSFVIICNIHSLDLLFLVAFISFCISKCHFSQVFRTSSNIIWKKNFRHKFSFFNRFTQTPISPLPQQPKSDKREFTTKPASIWIEIFWNFVFSVTKSFIYPTPAVTQRKCCLLMCQKP